MKSKLLLLAFFMLLTVTTNYAQSSAEQAGIAVQGIARDDNNTALINQNVRFKFTLYYKSVGDKEIHNESPTITTDEFGVFSHVIDVPASASSYFANYTVWLRIEDLDNDVTISNEIFKHVPYAIAANNGVPTGSIMPFVGAAAPPGWALCNGDPIPNDNGEGANLIFVQGGKLNTPDLRGMFLRGTGTNETSGFENYAGPALNTMDKDSNKEHSHETTEDEHAHNFQDIYYAEGKSYGSSWSEVTYKDIPGGYGSNSSGTNNEGWQLASTTEGAKTKNLKIEDSGETESRPVNYGVNYIIKL